MALSRSPTCHSLFSDCETAEFDFDCSNVTNVTYPIYLAGNESEVIDSMDFVIELFGLNGSLAGSISDLISVEPPYYTVDANTLYEGIWFTVTYNEGGQTTATCKFGRTVLRKFAFRVTHTIQLIVIVILSTIKANSFCKYVGPKPSFTDVLFKSEDR